MRWCGLQGELATDHDVVEFIMNQPSVVPRINPRVLSTSRTYLDLSDTSEYEGTPVCLSDMKDDIQPCSFPIL